MEQSININQISTLMNENSLTISNKEKISLKFENLINFINSLSTSIIEGNEINELLSALAEEQLLTAKILVSKNDSLSKNLIRNMTNQKESLLQTLEISQLRLEAELKNLNDNLNLPALKTRNSFLAKLFSILKIPFNSSKRKKAIEVNPTREKITLTTSKLTALEKRKEDVSKEFGDVGIESLKYLNKITYNALLPVNASSLPSVEKLKKKISILN